MIKLFLMAGSLFCMLSVVLGAFAAHGLKSRVSEYAIGVFKTAAELVLADVKEGDLYALWQALAEQNLARPNVGKLTDMIVCPGFDYCGLANARTLNIADQINEKFEQVDYLHDIGDISLNMSGCINACGHHHVGNIGILGVDKKGEDWYQITLGGSSGADASLGKVLGKAVAADDVANTLDKLLTKYIDVREGEESFLETVRRTGLDPFKEAVYAPAH